MAGKFVLKKGSSGKYHFNLLARNGQVIATSETYERKESALNGIESVKDNAPGAEVEGFVAREAQNSRAGEEPEQVHPAEGRAHQVIVSKIKRAAY